MSRSTLSALIREADLSRRTAEENFQRYGNYRDFKASERWAKTIAWLTMMLDDSV